MLSEEKMRMKLLVYIRDTYKTQRAAAGHWGISPGHVSNMITGLSPITKQVLDELGFEKVKLTKYEKKK